MEAVVVVSRVLLLLAAVLLAGEVCGGMAYSGVGGGGFTVEFIHRDSTRSPFHDPALTVHERALAAARRSTVRAAAIARSYGGIDDCSYGGIDDASPSPGTGKGGDIVSQVMSRSFEYLMTINVGTPPTQMFAIADTGSDLVWVNCQPGAGATSPSPGTAPPAVVFDPSASGSYARASCDSTTCKALESASCGAGSDCLYQYSYGDGSQTSGILSTDTFTFDDGESVGSQVHVPSIAFGCSTENAGTFRADGLVGLGGGTASLVSQLANGTSLGRKFSYCLVPYSLNLASALNFGARANVAEPGAATTSMIASKVDAYYTVSLESVKVAGQAVASHPSPMIVDSGTTLTFLDEALLGPLVDGLSKSIKLPRADSPEKLLRLCYDVTPGTDLQAAIPLVTLELGGGAAVTLRPENTFVQVKEGTLCLAIVAVSDQQPDSILGNIAQQNFHVGYDLDGRTVTFAAANCATSSPSAAPPS